MIKKGKVKRRCNKKSNWTILKNKGNRKEKWTKTKTKEEEFTNWHEQTIKRNSDYYFWKSIFDWMNFTINNLHLVSKETETKRKEEEQNTKEKWRTDKFNKMSSEWTLYKLSNMVQFYSQKGEHNDKKNSTTRRIQNFRLPRRETLVATSRKEIHLSYSMEISWNRRTPNHPYVYGIFHSKPIILEILLGFSIKNQQFLGYPPFLEPPCSWDTQEGTGIAPRRLANSCGADVLRWSIFACRYTSKTIQNI